MDYHGNSKILLPWGVSIHRIFYSVYTLGCLRSLYTCMHTYFIRFGASISSNTATSSGAFEMLAFNAQCFIIFENPAIPPPEWTNVSQCLQLCVIMESIHATFKL